MGQRDSFDWESPLLVWGEDAGWAWRQQQLRDRLHQGEGQPLLKAEQWADLDRIGLEDPCVAFQYDRFQPATHLRAPRGQ